MKERKKLLFVFGTRPEAIKLAPVIAAARAREDRFETRVAVTAQHRGLLDDVMSVFGMAADMDMDLMRPGQSLFYLTAAIIQQMEGALARFDPDVVVVQGDTTTVFTAALGAFYARKAVAHVEAGLRTGDKAMPFPEEINRRLVSSLADYHFAPTESARRNLLREGVAEAAVHVTGNTVIDALHTVLERHPPDGPCPAAGSAGSTGNMGEAGRTDGDGRADGANGGTDDAACAGGTDGAGDADGAGQTGVTGIFDAHRRVVLITGHRRENFGAPFRAIWTALADSARRYPDTAFVYPVHPNPNVIRRVREILKDLPNCFLIPPLPYPAFCWCMARSHLIVTDSGGIQEEAPALGKPVLVTRRVTERPEAVDAGIVKLVGHDGDAIRTWIRRLMEDPEAYSEMARGGSPYGDGKASGRILDVLGG